jgi:hypothetical protein
MIGVKIIGNRIAVAWRPVADVRTYSAYVQRNGRWTLAQVTGQTQVEIAADGTETIAIAAVSRCGVEGAKSIGKPK